MTPRRTPRRTPKRRTPKGRRTPRSASRSASRSGSRSGTPKRVPAVGSRQQVMHGHAHHTSGGLTKNDLTYNKWGAIVSKKKQQQAKKRWPCIKDTFKANKAKPFTGKSPRRSRSKSKSPARKMSYAF